MSYGRNRNAIAFTIPNGTALSDELGVGADRIVGVVMPAGWTAANLTLQAAVAQSATNPPVITWGDVVDDAGTEIVLATAPGAGEYVAIADTRPLLALGVVRLRSGTGGVPVNQGAERVGYLITTDV